MMLSVFHILFYVIFCYLTLVSAYFLIISLAGRLRRGFRYTQVPDKKKIAILIPSYREDHIIIDTASKALMHDYPPGCFDVFVIADKLQQETIGKMRQLSARVIEVHFETSTKAKSLHMAIHQIDPDRYDLAMILDADNVMAPGCLEKINQAFHLGYQAVQCHRVAKNKNNSVAVLDTLSEEINNNLFRRGQRAFGFSAALIGSGMAFEFDRLKRIFSLPAILDNAGEDREIDLQLMRERIVVEFIEDAWVYDEKVASAAVFQKQRQRWIEAQINNIKRFLDPDIRALANRRSYWYKLFQTLLLPRSLYLLLFFVLGLLLGFQYILKVAFMAPAYPWWSAIFLAFCLSLVISVPARLYNREMLKALKSLPVLTFSMVKVLLKAKPARKEFLHTPKVHTGK